MKDFKEWLSDYLRYFMLALAVILLFVLVLFGVRIYRGYSGGDAQEAAGMQTETGRADADGQTESEPRETEAGRATEAESQETEAGQATEAEPGATELESKSGETAAEPERAQTDSAGSGAGETKESGTTAVQNAAEQEAAALSGIRTDGEGVQGQMPAQAGTNPQTGTAAQSGTNPQTGTAVQTEAKPQTETAVQTETDPPEPVYMTLKNSCYIRSGPGYEYEIIGEYMYGTTVQFLEDAGGWYKVEVDGMVGYMGARFF